MDIKLPPGTVTTPFRFVNHITPHGFLPDTTGAHACWYYARIAITHFKAVDEGADYEGEIDNVNSVNNLAQAVAVMYRLNSPADFLKYMDEVKLEAIHCDLPWDIRIERPSLTPYIRTGN